MASESPEPEEIVRDLACHPPMRSDHSGMQWCFVCAAPLPPGGEWSARHHWPSCPWRRALIWAALR